jgi:predicted glutamine amidotransferase
MCRLAAFIGDMRAARPFIESFRELGHANPDGWGIGAYVHGQPKLLRSTMSAVEDPMFGRPAWLEDAPSAIMHLRKATVGEVSIANTHPFLVGSNITAHNGTFGAVDAVEARLGDDLQRLGVRDAKQGHSLIQPFRQKQDGAVTVFASRPLDATEGWQELPPGKLLRVRASDLREEMYDVMDVEPAMRYTDPHMDRGMPWLGRRRSTIVERELSA